MRNNLFINRLVILTTENKIAYDETFHKGVNIIRGDNSSGKSTITHFIFYVLGGAFNDWVPEAKKCSLVTAEVEMTGAIFTIKREIVIEKDKEGKEKKPNDKVALYFYWGPYEESLNPPPEKYWMKFEYNTTDNKKSFSNVLFENLGLPIVKGETNITFHQILRLLYIDQESPTSSLFLYEQFDSQITRETVADLLLGVYNQKLYDDKKKANVIEKDLDDLKREIKITEQFFSDPLTLNSGHLLTTIDNRLKDIQAVEDEIIDLRTQNKEVKYDIKDKLNFEVLNEEVINQRVKVAQLEGAIETLNYEIEDSVFFIETLRSKTKALQNSILSREFLGEFPLEYCPECLTMIKDQDVHSTTCKLCKEIKDESYGASQARKMEQEVSFQINESAKLLEVKKRRLLEEESKLESEKVSLYQLQKQVNFALNDVKPVRDENIDNLFLQKGQIEGEILQLRTLLESAELYKRLLERKVELDRELKYLKSVIWKTEQEQNNLKEKVNSQIEEEGVYLLNKDLDRQADFIAAKEFHIDFSNNIAFLSNKFAKYSASSNFYLKISARFAIFLASIKIDEMRYPRFIFADNMEDKGIEPARAQNLQKILISRLSEYAPNIYQMIYTTSYITDELNNSPYCVGEYYTITSPSLKNIPD